MKDMNVDRFTANHRAEFARERHFYYVSNWHETDTISGFKARKIAQAYRIYCYYLFIFNNNYPAATAVGIVRMDDNSKRKKNKNYISRRKRMTSPL